jgi:hypothetical protein
MHELLCLLVLVVLASPAWADVPPVPPTPPEQSLTVTVDAPKRMKVHPRKGLQGKIEVHVRNGTDTAVELVDPEILGLLFSDPDTGGYEVIAHSCFCVMALSEPASVKTLVLAPGESHTMVFDDFGCGGGPWKAPPTGTYWVTYQLHPLSAPQALRNRDPQEGSPHELTDACRALVTGVGYATDAIRSPSVKVTLH